MPRVYPCQRCDRVLPTSQGLKSHNTRLHKSAAGVANGSSLPLSSASQTVLPSGISSSQTLVKTLAQNYQPLSGSSPLDLVGTDLDDEQHLHSTTSGVPLEILLGRLHGNTKIIHKIPKGARSAVAEALSSTIDRCVRENSVSSWERLLLFASVCLQVPGDQEIRKVSLATLVKRNVADFLQGMTPVCCQGSRSEQIVDDVDLHLAKRVEAKMADGDVVGAVRLMSSEDSFAPHNLDTKQALLNLHPLESSSSVPFPEPIHGKPRLQVKDLETRGAIVSFPPGSAGGLDMLRPRHLKDLIGPGAGNAGLRLLTSIRCLCNVMLAGEVPSAICPILYGASLCALLKKNGGIRPIAIGSIWRRLVAKMGSYHVKSRLGASFQPIQLGFGTKGGAEAAAHAARRFVSYDHKDPKVFLKIDFRNAYNTVDRRLMLQAVSEQMPELLPFVSQCYRDPSHLAFGEELLSSQRGIQQGDPLGPALFCLMVHPIASSVSSELNIWYLDDAALGGHPDVVRKDLESISEKAAVIGLEINFDKCELFCLSGSCEEKCIVQESFREIASDIQFPELSNFTLLGAPLVPEAIETCLMGKTRALKQISDRLSLVKAHVAFYLLKNSQSIPKLSYVLRCAPTWRCEEGLNNFDAVLKEALESVSNTHLDTVAWDQSALPIAQGGLGIRHAQDLAVPAFLASVHSVAELTESILPPDLEDGGDPACVEGYMVWARSSGCEPPTGDKKMCQKEWESPCVERSRARIHEQAATVQDKARLLGVASGESGAFLNVIPSAPLGTLLDDNAFRIAIALRLGSQVCQEHVCHCGTEVDGTGVHGLTCMKSAGRRARHAEVNDIIRRGLVSANIPATLEPSHLSSSDNSRPDGITQIPWAGGKSLIWDFTCVNGLSPSHVLAASVEPLYAARTAEANKIRKYLHLSSNYTFVPIAVECLGSIGRDGLKVLRDIGRRIADATGEKRASEYLLQRISVAVQRGNASSIMGTIPPSSSLGEVFYIC